VRDDEHRCTAHQGAHDGAVTAMSDDESGLAHYLRMRGAIHEDAIIGGLQVGWLD